MRNGGWSMAAAFLYTLYDQWETCSTERKIVCDYLGRYLTIDSLVNELNMLYEMRSEC